MPESKGSPSSQLDSLPQLLDLHSVARIEHATDGSSTTLRHAFDDAEIAYFLNLPDCHAIVSHGLPQQSHEALCLFVATEHAPVFVHRDNPLRGLSTEQVLSIVRGEITSWDELGTDRRGDIHLHLHGGELQHSKLIALLRSMGVSRRELAAARPRFHDSYATLDASASSDPLALVIGLKTTAGSSLIMVAIDGIMPMRAQHFPYALALQIHMLLAESDAAQHFATRLAVRLQDNREAFDAYMVRTAQLSTAIPHREK